ncbi:hypothetical protein GCK32_016736 [Trichostrongylus colubriformis]|uniref:Uncharacterized protein n=1 Tax=Trichostrongylus colubriformis TaxID=6319 RepID=A0AAN8IN56_TRICO
MYESTQANYTAVYFIIHLRRSSTFYVVMIILPSFILTFLCLALGFAAILAMCTVLEIAEQSTPKTEQLPALSLFIMVNLLVVTVAISIVVMGSKCCQFTSATRLVEGSKKCMPSFRIKLCLSLRKICLIVFPILTLINLLILLLNLRS